MMLPAIFASAAHEIGQLTDIYLATLIREKVPEAVSALTYSHRLIHLPLGVFGVAIATASLPQLSKLHKENQVEDFSQALFSSVRLNLFLLVPATLFLIIFAIPLTGLLFERGEFNHESTLLTAFALSFYSIGIPAYGMQKLFLSSLYAQKNSLIPALITAGILVINVGLSYFFMKFLDHGGLALGSSLAAYIGLFLYSILLTRKGYLSLTAQHAYKIGKILLANGLLAASLFLLNKVTGFWPYYARIFSGLVGILVFYAIFSHLFHIEEWHIFRDLLQKFTLRYRKTK